MNVKAIVLAAGKSSRMGTNKLLLLFDNKPVLEHILDRLTKYETFVVTGYNPEDIEKILFKYDIKILHNPDYENGMTSTFKKGLSAIGDNVDAVFLVLGDTFGFNPELLEKMVNKMESTKALIISPIYDGKRGHPVLISSKLFPEFMRLDFNQTLRDLILLHERDHQYVNGDIWTRIDLDTPEDYEKVKKIWSNL